MDHHFRWKFNHQFVVTGVTGPDPAKIFARVIQARLPEKTASDAAMSSEVTKVHAALAGTTTLAMTYMYDMMPGITSKADPAGRITYYDCAVMGCRMDIRDQNGNDIKTLFYHYAN